MGLRMSSRSGATVSSDTLLSERAAAFSIHHGGRRWRRIPTLRRETRLRGTANLILMELSFRSPSLGRACHSANLEFEAPRWREWCQGNAGWPDDTQVMDSGGAVQWRLLCATEGGRCSDKPQGIRPFGSELQGLDGKAALLLQSELLGTLTVASWRPPLGRTKVPARLAIAAYAGASASGLVALRPRQSRLICAVAGPAAPCLGAGDGLPRLPLQVAPQVATPRGPPAPDLFSLRAVTAVLGPPNLLCVGRGGNRAAGCQGGVEWRRRITGRWRRRAEQG